LRKTDFNFFSHLISVNRFIVGLISIKSNIIWRWRQCQRQRGGSTAAAGSAAAVWWWRRRQRGSGGGSLVAATAPWRWQLGGRSLAAAAWGRQRWPSPPPLRCCRIPPRWQQRHRDKSNGRGTDNQQSTESSGSNGNGNGNNDSDDNDNENKDKGGSGGSAASVVVEVASVVVVVVTAWWQLWQLGGGSLAVAAWGWRRWRLQPPLRCRRVLSRWRRRHQW
jgi:hypothetical protein